MAHQLLKYCFYWRGKCTEAVLNQWASEEIIVITTCGPVIGYRRRTSDNKYIFTVFKGIAYAKPPVGELRFRVRIQYAQCSLVTSSIKADVVGFHRIPCRPIHGLNHRGSISAAVVWHHNYMQLTK